MDISEFFKEKHVTTRPIFITTEDVTVDTYVWYFGNSPYMHKEVFTIPKGTELIVSEYSNFGDGYSMKPISPRKVFKGKHLTHRWFRCDYSKMEFCRREFVGG